LKAILIALAKDQFQTALDVIEFFVSLVRFRSTAG
jgi:hypothetical protein